MTSCSCKWFKWQTCFPNLSTWDCQWCSKVWWFPHGFPWLPYVSLQKWQKWPWLLVVSVVLDSRTISLTICVDDLPCLCMACTRSREARMVRCSRARRLALHGFKIGHRQLGGGAWWGGLNLQRWYVNGLNLTVVIHSSRVEAPSGWFPTIAASVRGLIASTNACLMLLVSQSGSLRGCSHLLASACCWTWWLLLYHNVNNCQSWSLTVDVSVWMSRYVEYGLQRLLFESNNQQENGGTPRITMWMWLFSV